MSYLLQNVMDLIMKDDFGRLSIPLYELIELVWASCARIYSWDFRVCIWCFGECLGGEYWQLMVFKFLFIEVFDEY